MAGSSTIDERSPYLRADWRFLLPTPQHGAFENLVLLGGSAGLADRLMEEGVARRVTCSGAPHQSADALVILDHATTLSSVGHALEALAPGGSLYYELDRRRLPSAWLASPRAARQALRNLGLAVTGIYWAAPSFANCRRYVPLGVAGALRWYITALCTAGTPVYRLLEAAVREFAGVGRRAMAGLAPWYAVTATAEHAPARAPSVFGAQDCPRELRLPGLQPLLITNGHGNSSRVTMLPFAVGSERPDAVVKVARLPKYNASVEHEQRILTSLHSRLSADVRRAIPRPLGGFHANQLAVSIESCASGRPVFASSSCWGVSNRQRLDDLRLATRWLTAFHQQSQLGPPEAGAAAFARRAALLFARYRSVFQATENEERLFAEVLDRAGALLGCPLPIVWQHHDFGPRNVFRGGSELTVIDWEIGWGEDVDPAGPALCDLIFFVTHWVFAARRLHDLAGWRRGLHDLLVEPDPSDEIIAAAHRALSEYMAMLHVDRRFLPLAVVYTWIEQALRRFDGLRYVSASETTKRTDHPFATYVSDLADHAEQFLAVGRGEW